MAKEICHSVGVGTNAEEGARGGERGAEKEARRRRQGRNGVVVYIGGNDQLSSTHT